MNSKWKRFFILISLALATQSTLGQSMEWGWTFGGHISSAVSRISGGSATADIGFRGGLITSYFFSDDWKLRSGFLYTQRHFGIKDEQGRLLEYDCNYLDVPALLQFRIAEGYGIYAGPTFGINTDLLVMLQVGANFIFDNMYGFDVFYERGFNNLDDNSKDPSAFGLNLIYYFL